MKHSGLFDRVRFLESRLDRLEAVLLAQDQIIRRQAKLLGLDRPPVHAAPEARDMVQIVADIANDNGLTLAEIKSKTKVAAICKPRQYAFAVLLDKGFSAAGIGRFFGMDHTTVLSGAARARAEMSAFCQLPHTGKP